MQVPMLGVELELHLRHMEVSRLEVKLAYATATATWDPRCICDLHHSSWQCPILNPLSKARDWTCVLMDASRIRFCWATTGTPYGLTLEVKKQRHREVKWVMQSHATSKHVESQSSCSTSPYCLSPSLRISQHRLPSSTPDKQHRPM